MHRSHLRRLGARLQQGRLRLAAVAGRLPPQAVQGLVAGGGDDPAARVGRHARGGPALRGHGEGLLDRLFGDVDVAEDADQGGHGTARTLPVGALDGGGIGARHSATPRRSPGTAGPPPARRRPRTPWPPRRARRPGRGPDDPEAAQLLLGLRERPVGGDHLAVLGADDRGRVGRVQAAGEDPGPGGLELGVERVDRLVPPLDLVLRGDRLPLRHVHREQVLPHASSPFTWPGTMPAPHLCSRTPPAGIDTRPAPAPVSRRGGRPCAAVRYYVTKR